MKLVHSQADVEVTPAQLRQYSEQRQYPQQEVMTVANGCVDFFFGGGAAWLDSNGLRAVAIS